MAKPPGRKLDTQLRAYLTKLAKRGGLARAKKLTAEERRQSAQKAVRARWAKKDTGGKA